MNVFVDTSALVKYFHEEKGTAAVTELIDNPENNIFVSDLSRLEFISALHRRYRRKEIGKKSLHEAIEAFDLEYSYFHSEPVSQIVMKEAEELLLKYGKEYGLRTLDSIQLATFLLFMNKNWLFVACDNNLIKVATALGANTFNPLEADD